MDPGLAVPVAMAVVDSASAGLRAASRASVVQLRAPGLGGRELAKEAIELVASSAVPIIVSSRCDVALAAGAAGVNLPERDIPIAGARTLLGDRLVGRSVHSLESAREAEREGADFVIFGPVWSSASHPGAAPAGLSALAAVARAVRVPVVAIGGVTEARIAECRSAGAAGYAAITLFRLIALQVNGKRVELDGPTPLTDYLVGLGADPRAVAVEHNGEIVERASYATLMLKEGDRVEIVRMVGGG